MQEVTKPCDWSRCLQKGQVGKGWSPREKIYKCDPKDNPCNAGRQEYDMRSLVEFSTEPTKEEWPSFPWRIRPPSYRTGARQFVITAVNEYTDELTPDVVSTPSGITGAQTDMLTMGARRCSRKFFMVYKCWYSESIRSKISQILS